MKNLERKENFIRCKIKLKMAVLLLIHDSAGLNTIHLALHRPFSYYKAQLQLSVSFPNLQQYYLWRRTDAS